MKKAIFITIYSMLVLGCLVLVFNYGYNAFVTYCYNKGNYSVSAKPLQMFNWTEKYVAYYNQGNIAYQNGEYLDAIEAYEKALELDPPEKKECVVRINLALAMLATIGDLYQDPVYVEEVLTILYGAKDVLLEDGCATEAGDGHSAEAEQLKKEIDEMIKELEKQQPQQSEKENSDDAQSSNEEEQNSTEESSEEDSFEKDVKEKMIEQREKANKERQEGMEFYRDHDYNFDYDGMIW